MATSRQYRYARYEGDELGGDTDDGGGTLSEDHRDHVAVRDMSEFAGEGTLEFVVQQQFD